ncbi:MAG: type III-A CRISPR-associated protein Cas10/Csm1 [Candidatus Micrarchaeaceae archaeon]
MEADEFVLTVASLLHDVGKVRQRYQKGISHSEHGYNIIRELYNIPDVYRERIAKLVRYHHAVPEETSLSDEDKHLLRILEEADRDSAAHDREDKDPTEDIDLSLSKIFELVEPFYEDDVENHNPTSFPRVTLDEFVKFPKDYLDGKISDNKDQSYEKIDRQLSDDLKSVVYRDDRKIEFIDTILSIIERDVIFVPSAFYYSKNNISLYDHLKLTAALALSIYRSRGTNQLVLIGSSLSGIQRYIFRHYVSEAADDKATRRLKGRSFMVGLINDAISSYLLRVFDLPRTNIIYTKTDGFSMIVNRSLENEEKIKSCRREIEKTILSFGRDIYPALGFVPFNISDLVDKSGESNFQKMVEMLTDSINERKYRILSDSFSEVKRVKEKLDANTGLCDYCGLDYGKMDEDRFKCDMCEWEEKIGRTISTSYRIYQSFKEVEGCFKFEFGSNIISYCFDGDRNLDLILIKMNPELGGNEKTFWRILLVGRYVPVTDNGILSINEMLCAKANCDKDGGGERKYIKLGIIKIDMDDMGAKLASGFKRFSISVYSSFMFFTNLFFSAVVDSLASIDDGKHNSVYIIYSGGDDLVAFSSDIGIMKYAERFHRYFNTYFAYPSMTASAGVAVFDAKSPIRRGVDFTEKELEKSKNTEKKNRITVFGVTMKWSEMSEMIDKAEKLERYVAEGKIGKIFLYLLLELHRKSIYESTPKKGRVLYVPDPYLSYYLTRNWTTHDIKERDDLIVELSNEKVFKNAKFIAYYSILMNRDKELMGVGNAPK